MSREYEARAREFLTREVLGRSVNDRMASALAVLLAEVAGGWQPIETAPKDRTILLWTGGEVIIGWWETAREFANSTTHFNDWSSGSYDSQGGYDCGFRRIHNPTHWMPLPAPPPHPAPAHEGTDHPRSLSLRP